MKYSQENNKNRIAFVLVTLLFILSCKGVDEQRKFPSFKLRLLDSVTEIKSDTIGVGKTVLAIYFSPDCEHCQKETKDILFNIRSLRNVQILFITNDPVSRIRVFNSYYRIFDFSNIILGQDYTFAFANYFKMPTPPLLAIFDKARSLRAVFSGETEAKHMIDFMQQM